MLELPAVFSPTILLFAPLFSKSVWSYAETLLIGAILAPAQRTVCSILRVSGRSGTPDFQNYHRVLSRARWSSREAARIVLRRIVELFVADGPILVVLDDTIERRRGACIKAKGIYRDPVRSSHAQMVKASGLRWLNFMVITDLPFTRRRWALPVLSLLAPSERYNSQHARTHKRLTDWARQGLLQLARWLPKRKLICLADSSFAAIDLLAAVREHVTMITRLRLDAALYEPAAELDGSGSTRVGRPRKKGARLPRLAELAANPASIWQHLTLRRWYQQDQRRVEILHGTALWYHSGKDPVPIRWVVVRDPDGGLPLQAFLSTDLSLTPQQILEYYVERWQVEVTYREAREHLGIETQRQWSDQSILRSTPTLFALYSIVALLASELYEHGQLPCRQSAWYRKEQITFSDALAAVRQQLWMPGKFPRSRTKPDLMNIPRPLFDRIIDTLCYGS